MTDRMVATATIPVQQGDSLEDGFKTFQPGDTVTGVDKDTMDRLIEIGAVEPKEVFEERREAPAGASAMEEQYAVELKKRDDEIASLRAQLEDANKAKQTAGSGTRSGPSASNK